jgi:integrase
MAHWGRLKDGRVRIYMRVDGKQTSLPRDKVKHLDAQPDDVVQRYFDSLFPKQPVANPLFDEDLSKLVDQFGKYHLHTDKKNPSTVERKEAALLNHIIPFFLSQDPPMKDPNGWPFRSAKLLEHLQNKGITDGEIIKFNVALNSFWKWLSDEGLVQTVALKLRRPVVETESTPLKFTLVPEDVLAFARNAEPWCAFIALTGYFFSLRPQEILALTRTDFRAGSSCNELECSKVMKKAGLFDRLTVNISKQNSKTLKSATAKPKANSKGWVACFNADAAKLLVVLIKELGEKAKDAPLVTFCVDYNLKRWREEGIPDVTMKDLRRASLYWLGHYSELGIVQIKNHARHSQIKTTELYLRRPDEVAAIFDDLDLNA